MSPTGTTLEPCAECGLLTEMAAQSTHTVDGRLYHEDHCPDCISEALEAEVVRLALEVLANLGPLDIRLPRMVEEYAALGAEFWAAVRALAADRATS